MSTKYDVAMWTKTGSKYELSMIGANDSGKRLTGVEKLAQKFVLELLTAKGSIIGKPTRGTKFIDDMSTTNINEVTIFLKFNKAMTEVYGNLLSDETVDTSDDERLLKASINRILLSQASGLLGLSVNIYTVAGSSMSINIPLNIRFSNNILTANLD